MKRLLAALAVAVLVACSPLAPVTRAQAATSAGIVCSKWITTYAGTAGVTTYRASILFAAARLQIETAANRVMSLTPTPPLAYDDYQPRPVKPEGPIDPTSRATITDEVKAVMGL